MDTIMDTFTASKPLLITIRDEFRTYDSRTKALLAVPKIMTIGAVLVNMKSVFQSIIEYSKVWKVKLGGKLWASYKLTLEVMVQFIKDQENVLCKTLHDLDDVRIAMNCLDRIRENCIE